MMLGQDLTEGLLNMTIKSVGLVEFVEQKGLDYAVGIRGNNLSSGQKKGVEIARALIFNRPILM